MCENCYKPAELDKLVSRIALDPDAGESGLYDGAPRVSYGINTKCSSPAGAGNGLGPDRHRSDNDVHPHNGTRRLRFLAVFAF